MKKIFSILAFIVLAQTTFAQFADTAALNNHIRSVISDKRPQKITANDLQSILLNITGIVSIDSTLANQSKISVPTEYAVYNYFANHIKNLQVTTGHTYIKDVLDSMLAINDSIGTMCILNDSSATFVLKAQPATDFNNWVKLRFPAAVPTVFDRTGPITALESDYSAYYPLLSGSYSNPSWLNSLAWSKVSNPPTTLGGYGIGDAYTKTEVDNVKANYVASITALENVVTNSTTVIVQDSLRGGTFNYVASATPDSGTVFPRYGGGYWQRNYKGAMNSQWFGGINAAITGIGAKNALLHISQAETLAANTTIPANVAVEILKGGSINVPSGDTLTINGTFKAGRYQVFSGSGLINFGSSSIDAQFPEWDGAKADGSNYCTAMFAKEYARNVPISLGVGSYLVDSITTGNLNYPLVIKGQGMKVSKITVAYGNVNGIWIGEQQTVANSVLKDFLISGHVGNKGGIALGNGTVTYNVGVAANTLIENVEVYNFSDTGQFGIELNEVQELNVHNCYLYQNWNNYWRPNYGFVTSTLIDGKAGYNGYSFNRGADLEGVINDITFKDQVFENNQNEAVYYDRVDGSPIINIQGNYFESNNKSGTANGIVSISGNQTSRFRPVAIIRNNVFYDPGDTTHTKIYLDNTHNSVVADNSGNMYPMKVSAGTNCYFSNNASFISGYGSAPMKNMYTKMYAISNKIIVDDWDTLGVPFHLGTLNLNTKAYYSSNPTFTPADSNSVINKRYADSLQALNFTGSGNSGYFAGYNGTKSMTNAPLTFSGSNIFGTGGNFDLVAGAFTGDGGYRAHTSLAGMSFTNSYKDVRFYANGYSVHLAAPGSTIPNLGAGGQFGVIGASDLFGLYSGITGSGDDYTQAGRSDGTATAYNWFLQPRGGSVGIGDTSAAQIGTYKLHVNGTLGVAGLATGVDPALGDSSHDFATTASIKRDSVNASHIRAGLLANGTTATTQATTDSSGALETTARVKQLLASLNVDLYADKGVAINTTLHPGHLTFVIDSAYVVDSISPYKVYMATVNNASGTTLTPTVLRNTLGGAITWTHTGTGDWTGTLTGAFTSGKTVEIIGSNQTKAVGQREYLIWFDANTVHFQVTDASGASIDGNISNEPIEIRVYK